MADVSITGIDARNLTIEITPEELLSPKLRKRIERDTIKPVTTYIETNYRETVNAILSLYAGQGLTRNAYLTGNGVIPTNHPAYSDSYSSYLRRFGINPDTKPAWGKVTGDLAEYARRVRVSDSAQLSNIRLNTVVTTKGVVAMVKRLFTGSGRERVASFELDVSLPSVSSPMLDSAIARQYLSQLQPQNSKVLLQAPRPESKRGARPEHAIWGEELVRPLIKPVARHYSSSAYDALFLGINKSLNQSLLGRFTRN